MLLDMSLSASDSYRKRFDPRTRRDRIHLHNLAWAEQIEQVVDAYLLWRIQPIVSSSKAPIAGEAKAYSVRSIDFFCKFYYLPYSVSYQNPQIRVHWQLHSPRTTITLTLYLLAVATLGPHPEAQR
jgi:hypothetical protein